MLSDRSPTTGTVVSFDEHRGLGEVTDGRDTWPFHCTSILDGSRTIAPGTAVSFETGPGGPGRWEASALKEVSQPAS